MLKLLFVFYLSIYLFLKAVANKLLNMATNPVGGNITPEQTRVLAGRHYSLYVTEEIILCTVLLSVDQAQN